MKYLKRKYQEFISEELEYTAKEFEKIRSDQEAKRLLRNKAAEKMGKEQAEKNKELEEKFPDLVRLFDLAAFLADEALKNDDEASSERQRPIGEKALEHMSTKGGNGLIELISSESKGLPEDAKAPVGLALILNFSKIAGRNIEFEKEISKTIPSGEKYDFPGLGAIEGGKEGNAQKIFDDIKGSLNAEILMDMLYGDSSQKEITYMTDDGKEATGEIKGVEMKYKPKESDENWGGASIEITIENENVGEITKSITEISGGKAEGGGIEDLSKRLSQLKAKDPDAISKVLSFAGFISDEKNKDEISKIDKILGI